MMLKLENIIEVSKGYVEVTDRTNQWVIGTSIGDFKERLEYKRNKRRGVLEVDTEIINDVPHLVIKI